jgi:hypothetical protein
MTPPPILIGAVGASGTRVVARIVARAGFFIGAQRNLAEDSEPVMEFFNTYLRPISHRAAYCRIPWCPWSPQIFGELSQIIDPASSAPISRGP